MSLCSKSTQLSCVSTVYNRDAKVLIALRLILIVEPTTFHYLVPFCSYCSHYRSVWISNRLWLSWDYCSLLADVVATPSGVHIFLYYLAFMSKCVLWLFCFVFGEFLLFKYCHGSLEKRWQILVYFLGLQPRNCFARRFAKWCFWMLASHIRTCNYGSTKQFRSAQKI